MLSIQSPQVLLKLMTLISKLELRRKTLLQILRQPSRMPALQLEIIPKSSRMPTFSWKSRLLRCASRSCSWFQDCSKRGIDVTAANEFNIPAANFKSLELEKGNAAKDVESIDLTRLLNESDGSNSSSPNIKECQRTVEPRDK